MAVSPTAEYVYKKISACLLASILHYLSHYPKSKAKISIMSCVFALGFIQLCMFGD